MSSVDDARLPAAALLALVAAKGDDDDDAPEVVEAISAARAVAEATKR